MAKRTEHNPQVTISKIKFNNDTEIEFSKDSIVVFVGGNNVGKSRTLKDIKNDIIMSDANKIMIKEISYDVENFNKNDIKNFFDNNFEFESRGYYNVPYDLNTQTCFYLTDIEEISSENKNFYKCFYNYLSTEQRLNMTSPFSYNGMIDKIKYNIITKLEKNSNLINLLNENIYSCFEHEVDVHEEMIQSNIYKVYKYGNKQEIDKAINANTRDARTILEKQENLHEQGDGIRSAVAVLSSLITTNHSIYLMDEPETFLHPPQARILGKNIAQLSKNKQCFISTHNIDLIRGLIEGDSSRVKIIKINRNNNENEFNTLLSKNINKLSSDKTLKFTNLLNSLFYKKVVLCEDETDCKFYSTILEHHNKEMYHNTLFCAVEGKGKFKKIIPILKELDIKPIIIADLDIINDKAELKALLNSKEKDLYNVISTSHKTFLDLFIEKNNKQIKTQENIKKEILKLFDDEKYMSKAKKDKAISILKDINDLALLKQCGKSAIPSGECRKEYNKIIKLLNQYNIFPVECGEIEKFIPEIDGHGNEWVEKVFNKYKKFDEEEYDQVKKFLDKVFK